MQYAKLVTNKKQMQKQNNGDVFVTITELANKVGLKANTVVCRLRRGWSLAEALSQKLGSRVKRNLVITPNAVYVPLTKNKSAIVDPNDLFTVRDRNWNLDSCGYPCSNGKRLHRVLLGDSWKGDIDHINRNKLDNRRSNLRLISHKENCWNKTIPINNSSGVIGVSFHKETKKWRAYICDGNIYRHLGLHRFKVQAVEARKQAENELRRKFRKNEETNGKQAA